MYIASERLEPFGALLPGRTFLMIVRPYWSRRPPRLSSDFCGPASTTAHVYYFQSAQANTLIHVTQLSSHITTSIDTRCTRLYSGPFNRVLVDIYLGSFFFFSPLSFPLYLDCLVLCLSPFSFLLSFYSGVFFRDSAVIFLEFMTLHPIPRPFLANP
jgi:hypothetical protein